MPKVVYPVVSQDADVQARYVAARQRGEAHGMAEVIAFRQAPGLHTDTQFVRDVRTPFGLSDTPANRVIAAKLRKAGADQSGVYMGALAKRTGDPHAVVRGRDDIKKVCGKRGWSCEGTVNVSANRDNFDPGKPVGVAPDLIERRLRQEASKDPSIVSTKKKANEARKRIRERIKPHWVKD